MADQTSVIERDYRGRARARTAGRRVAAALYRVLQALLVLLLAATVAIVAINVGMRYLLGMGLPWSEELARLLFVWMVFLGGAVAVRDRVHLRVVEQCPRLPPRVSRVTRQAIDALSVVLLVVLVVQSVRLLRLTANIGLTSLPLPTAVVYAALTFGGALMAAFLAVDILTPQGNGQDGRRDRP